jgi:hypothetical protein
MAKNQTEAQPEMVVVAELQETEHVLLQPITYYGEDKAKGDKVLLWPDQVERLREQGVIE